MVGLGIMGSAMCARLLGAGFPVLGFDVDPARMAQHERGGGRTAASAGAVASASRIVITSLPSTAAFEAVVAELAAGRGGAPIVVDTSTLPLTAKDAAQHRLARAGRTLLDCPISGTGAQARVGDLVLYLSGDDASAKEAVLPVLRAFSRRQYDVGPFGNGSRLKYVANLLVAIHNLAAAEALLLADRSGLDRQLTLEAVGDGAGSSRMLQVRGPLMVQETYDEATMRVATFQKDIDIIRSFARELRCPTPLFALASAFYDAAEAQGRGSQDTACLFAVLQQLASPDPPAPDEHPA